jgi:hypothetical protein
MEVVATVMATGCVRKSEVTRLELQAQLVLFTVTKVNNEPTSSEYVLEVRYQRPVAGSMTPVPDTPMAG